MERLIIIGTFFLFFFVLFLSIGLMMFGKKRAISKRLERYFPQINEMKENYKEKGNPTVSFLKKLGQLLPWQPLNRKWEKKLRLAGIKINVSEFFALRLLLTVLFFILLFNKAENWSKSECHYII